MSTTHRFVQCALLTVIALLAACAPAVPVQPTTAPTEAPTMAAAEPTVDATATHAAVIAATALPAESSLAGASLRVGLVTDTGGVNDGAFNQLAWTGVQRAAETLGFETRLLESGQPDDYEANIDALANDGAGVIITVGSQMAEATAVKARQYPDIRFAIVDHAYVPTSGSPACPATASDCYADGGLINVTSLMFAEDQLGFLAGVLAGGMTRSSFVCSVTSVAPPASDRYVINFRVGAGWQAGEGIRGMNNYINIQTPNANMPNFTDPTDGQETAQKLIDAGCDVVFAIAADGALLAARQNGVMAIGAEVDQYQTVPEAQAALLSSAQKRVDNAVYNYLTTVADDSVRGGVSIASLQNGGVGLAPFHDWDSQISAELRARIQQASEGLMNGSISTN